MKTCSCGERYHSEQGRIDCEKSHARKASRGTPFLTLAELRFLRTEIYSALSCGAEDRMFEQVHAKLEAIIRARGGNPMKREFKPDSQSDAGVDGG